MRKLKLKFIGIASLSLLMVLLFVLGLVNFISYKNTSDEIFSTLKVILENSGSLPEYTSFNYFEKYDLTVTAESIYETRYFTVELDSDGNPVRLNVDNIAAVEIGEIADFTNIAQHNVRNRGFFVYDGLTYAFMRTSTESGGRLIAFLDSTSRLGRVEYFVRFSLYVGIICMLLLFLLLSIFSRKAMAPYIKNIESQKQFITNASHELKTPLAVISANAEVIEMMDGKSEWTDSIKTQVTRMSELISQLIVLSKLQERDDIVLSDVSFSEKTEDVVKSMRTVAEAQGKGFESEIAENVTVKADDRGLRELVSILIDNAVKYCDDGGKVTINLSTKGRRACLTVSNDYAAGAGQDYSRFFERFYRADESHNSGQKGYGIGLSMAERLVEMFGGKISVGYKNEIITFSVFI